MLDPRTRSAVTRTGAFLLGWLAFAELLAPRLITWLYTTDALAGVELVVHERTTKPLSYFLDRWLTGERWGVVAVVAILLVHLAVRNDGYRRRHVGEATPGTLGAIRALVCTILLTNVLWEDLVSTAYLPREMFDPDGLLELFYGLPFGAGALLERLAASPAALGTFQLATAALLLLGALGWRTRVVLPAAAAACLLFGGLLRQYAWFYHTGLVPLYVLAVLCFTPAGDGLSLDRLRRLRAGAPVPAADRPAAVYGWSRYAVWLTIALPYVEAGLSKLRRSGLDWFHPENLRAILLTDTLNPMEFHWHLALGLVHLPQALAALLGVGALGTEVAFGLVLVSRRARRVIPAMMAAVHLGILFLQNVLFFDLILLQAVFYDWSPVGRRVASAWRRLAPGWAASVPAPALAAPPSSERWPRRLTVLASVLLVAWAARVEFYPVTAMQMYSEARTTGRIEYFKVLAADAAGHRGRAPIEQSVGAMADSRYRKLMYDSFEPAGRPVAEELLRTVAARHDRTAGPGARIVRFDVELWRWDYLHHPDDPDHGERVDAWSLSVPEPGEAGGQAALTRSASSATAP